jgi:membrane protein
VKETIRAVPHRTWQAISNFRKDRCSTLAAGVAYYGLLALAPFLYLALVTLGAIFRDLDAAPAIVGRLEAFVPADVRPAVEQLVAELQAGHALAWIVIPALVWVATNAFSALDYAVNVAFDTAPRRKFWRSQARALAVLGGGWFLLTLSLVGGAVIPRLDSVYRILGVRSVADPLTELGSTAVVWGVDFVAFFAFYRLLPRTRVRNGPAATAAIAAVLMWQGIQQLAGWLVGRSPAYGLWSGTLTGAAALIVWMHVAVSVVLLGAELAAAWNGSRDRMPPVA